MQEESEGMMLPRAELIAALDAMLMIARVRGSRMTCAALAQAINELSACNCHVKFATSRNCSQDKTPLVSRLLDSAQIGTLPRWVTELMREAADALECAPVASGPV